MHYATFDFLSFFFWWNSVNCINRFTHAVKAKSLIRCESTRYGKFSLRGSLLKNASAWILYEEKVEYIFNEKTVLQCLNKRNFKQTKC